jgi:hypothetical protein
MKSIKHIVPWVAAAAIAGAIGLAPVASAATHPAPLAGSGTNNGSVGAAGTDPLVPYGSDPYTPYRLGYFNPNHDEGNTTNGELDVPF